MVTHAAKGSSSRTKGRRRFGTLTWLAFMVAFFVIAGFHTWCRLLCTQESVRIDEAQQQRRALLQLQTKLKVELARLKSPARIATIAHNRLGLGMPAPGQVIVLK
ncbi:MAG: cell division protein FtsL [Desulfosarcinaceae bacterium]